MRITVHDKLACVDRELKRRRRVYPGRVLTHRMSKADAERGVAVMAAIVEDYIELVALDTEFSDEWGRRRSN